MAVRKKDRVPIDLGPKKAAKRSAGKARAPVAIPAWLSSLIDAEEKIEVAPKFGHATFSVGGKVFSFIRPDGTVLKLPEQKIKQLLEDGSAELLVMGKRAMREWIVVRANAERGHALESRLFIEAMEFVASLQGKDPRRRIAARVTAQVQRQG